MNPLWLDGITRSTLTSTERWVLVCWLRHADERGVGSPSTSQISEESGFGDRSVRRVLKSLRSRRVLRDLHRVGHGRWRCRGDVGQLR